MPSSLFGTPEDRTRKDGTSAHTGVKTQPLNLLYHVYPKISPYFFPLNLDVFSAIMVPWLSENLTLYQPFQEGTKQWQLSQSLELE